MVGEPSSRASKRSVLFVCLDDLPFHGHAAGGPDIGFRWGSGFFHHTIVSVSVPVMDIDPQKVIDALSGQIGALQTENTILKMALQQVQNELIITAGDAAGPPPEEAKRGKKKTPEGANTEPETD